MILADSSAWIEFLRGTGSRTARQLETHIRGEEVVVTDPVLMEVLAGARDDHEWVELSRMLGRFEFARVENGDWLDAARLRRTMAGAGRTLRNAIDCLIAVVAIRTGSAVLSADADFAAIAELAPLRIA